MFGTYYLGQPYAAQDDPVAIVFVPKLCSIIHELRVKVIARENRVAALKGEDMTPSQTRTAKVRREECSGDS